MSQILFNDYSYDITRITKILYKIYFKKFFEGGRGCYNRFGFREKGMCLALNFRHVSFLQVRKNNPCQANIHVYAVYINKQPNEISFWYVKHLIQVTHVSSFSPLYFESLLLRDVWSHICRLLSSVDFFFFQLLLFLYE